MTGKLRNIIFSYFSLIYGDCCFLSREVEVDYFDTNLYGDCQVRKKNLGIYYFCHFNY